MYLNSSIALYCIQDIEWIKRRCR